MLNLSSSRQSSRSLLKSSVLVLASLILAAICSLSTQVLAIEVPVIGTIPDFDYRLALKPTREWPAMPLDINAWVGYLFGTLLCILVPLVVGIVLMILCCCWCCCRCCCCNCCGGQKPYKSKFMPGAPRNPRNLKPGQGYRPFQRKITWAPCMLLTAILIVATVVGIVFVGLFTGHIATMITSAWGLVDGLFGLVTAVIGKMHDVQDTFGVVGGVISGVQSQATSFNTKTSALNLLLGNASDSLQNIIVTINSTDSDVKKMRELSYWLGQSQYLSSARIDSNEAPDLASSLLPSLENTQKSLADSMNSANSSLSSATGSINSALESMSKQVDTMVNSLNSTVASAEKTINNVMDSYVNTYFGPDIRAKTKLGINIGLYVAMAVVIVVFSWGALILILGGPCVLGQKACWTSFMSVLIIITVGAYIIIPTLELAVTIFGSDICQRGKPYLLQNEQWVMQKVNLSALIPMSSIPIPGLSSGNSSSSLFDGVSPVEVVLGIATCSGDELVTDFMGINAKSLLNATKLLDPVLSQVDGLFANLNMTNQLDSVRNGLNFTMDTTQFSNFQQNLTSYQSTVHNMSTTVQNDQANIVSAEGQAYYDALIYNITALSWAIGNISSALTSTQSSLSAVQTVPTQLNAALTDMASFAGTIKTLVNTQLGLLLQSVQNVLDLDDILGCSWLGNFINTAVQETCGYSVYFIAILTASGLAVGLLLFALFPVTLIMTKRFRYKYNDTPGGGVIDEHEMYNMLKAAGKKNRVVPIQDNP